MKLWIDLDGPGWTSSFEGVEIIRDGERFHWHDGYLLDGPLKIGTLVQIPGSGLDDVAKIDGLVIVETNDWRVIPIENILAARADRPGTVIAVVRNTEEMALHANSLEVGVAGFVLRPTAAADLQPMLELARQLADTATATAAPAQAVSWSTGEIVSIEPIELADRACIDLAENLEEGQGAAVGCTAASMCFVLAETAANEYIEARPFRINAGAICQYTFVSGGRTRYLSEMRGGDSLEAGEPGELLTRTIGRMKFEKRPHRLVRWTCGDRIGHAILQAAETVRLQTPAGPRSILDLQVGDKLTVANSSKARHFGMAISESILER